MKDVVIKDFGKIREDVQIEEIIYDIECWNCIVMVVFLYPIAEMER